MICFLNFDVFFIIFSWLRNKITPTQYYQSVNKVSNHHQQQMMLKNKFSNLPHWLHLQKKNKKLTKYFNEWGAYNCW